MVEALLSKGNRPRVRDKPVARAIVGHRHNMPMRPTQLSGRPLQDWLSSWVYICVNANATACGQQSIHLYRSDGSTERKSAVLTKSVRAHLKSMHPQRLTENSTEILDHPFLDAIDWVNPLLTRCDLWYLTVANLQIHGNAFWKLTYDSIGRISEIWPLPAHAVWLLLGEDRIIDRYAFRMYGNMVEFSPDEIVHFRQPSPLDLIAGLGQMRAILDAAETNLRMKEYETALFKNFASPDLLISLKGDPGEEQLKQLETDFKREYGGWRQAGKVGFFPGEVTVNKLGFTNRDMQFKDGRSITLDEITAGFGVPVNVVRVDGMTFNNMRHGLQLWMRQTIQPLLVRLAETLNSFVMPIYSDARDDDGLSIQPKSPWFVAFDDPVPEDVDADADRWVRLLQSGGWTPNEMRRERGDPEEEWGDEPFLPGGVRLLSEPLPGAEGVEEAMAANDGKSEETESLRKENDDLKSKPPFTLNELTAGIERLVGVEDESTAQMLRETLADMLGKSPPEPIDQIRQGKINPDEEDIVSVGALNGAEEPGANKPPKGKPNEQNQEDEEEPPKKKDEDGKDKAATMDGHEDGDTRVVGKLDQREVERMIKDHAFTQDLRSILEDFETQVKRKFESFLDLHTKADKPEYSIPKKDAFLAALFDQDEWAEKLMRVGQPHIAKAFETGEQFGERDVQGLVGEEMGFRLSPEKVIERVRVLTERFASKVVDVKGDELYEQLSHGMRDGERPTDLFKRVAMIYGGEAGDYNAERIVRTELSRAMNNGAMETWKGAGIKEKQWLRSSDACEFCDLLSNKRVEIGGAFVKNGTVMRGASGKTFTPKYGDVLHPPLHPHCTCTHKPIVE